MELYLNGEDMAFNVIYLRHKNKVFSYLAKRLGDSDSIDDIFQRVFIKFHKSRFNYNSEFPLLKWIYTICRSELLDHLKKKKILTIEFNEEFLPPSEQEKSNKVDLESIKSLKPKEREALELRFYSDKDYSEISKLLNISESNSRKIVSRALGKLRLVFLRGVK